MLLRFLNFARAFDFSVSCPQLPMVCAILPPPTLLPGLRVVSRGSGARSTAAGTRPLPRLLCVATVRARDDHGRFAPKEGKSAGVELLEARVTSIVDVAGLKGEPEEVARFLSLSDDQLLEPVRAMRASAAYLSSPLGGIGLSKSEVHKEIAGYPHLLSFGPERLRAQVAVLREIGIPDVRACVMSLPGILGLPPDRLRANVRILRKYGVVTANSTAVLTTYTKLLTLDPDQNEAKLRFFIGGLRFPVASIARSNILTYSLERAQKWIAILAQLGGELPPLPTGDGTHAANGGSNLSTIMTKKRPEFVAYLVGRGHPTIRTADDLKKAEASPQLLEAVKKQQAAQAERIREAERMGIIPPL